MFIQKYLSDLNYDLLTDKYLDWYINSIDENNFIKVYNIFKKYNFYFIEDIIVNYLEIFSLESDYVEKKLLILRNFLGDKFNYVIGNDMTYLQKILNEIDFKDDND